MGESKRDDVPERPQGTNLPPSEAGILKEREKRDLEGRIVETMRSLGSKLTRKEIIALAQRVEVSKGLDGLKRELESDPKIAKEIPEETLKEFMDLIRNARELAESGLEELKLEIGKTNPTRYYDIDKSAYFSSRFPWVKRMEESELGENLVIDVAGFLTGALDSAVGAAKLLLLLIRDFFLLPVDAYRHYGAGKSGKGPGA